MYVKWLKINESCDFSGIFQSGSRYHKMIPMMFWDGFGVCRGYLKSPDIFLSTMEHCTETTISHVKWLNAMGNMQCIIPQNTHLSTSHAKLWSQCNAL